MTMSAQSAPNHGSRARPVRPRLLYLAMYDLREQDAAPKVRIRLLGEALGRQAEVTWVSGGRRDRIRPTLAWLARRGMGSVDAVYVESPTSVVTPLDLALLAWARLRGRPVGIYFRDAYQMYRHDYPRARRRQLLADLAWRVSLPLLRAVASVRFAPTPGLARVLGLGPTAVPMPPGMDPTSPDLSAGPGPVVAYVGGTAAADGFDRLLAAMELVRETIPTARLRVVARVPRATTLPAWVELGPGTRDVLAERLRDARVCVIPRPITPYTDLAMPVKLMDYLGFGKPVVATAAVETAAFLGRWDCGVVVGDRPDELAEGIRRVLQEPGLAERLAVRARAVAGDPALTWDGRAEQLLASLVGEEETWSRP